MDKASESKAKIDDRCPTWAVQLIGRIRDLEIDAGHINPEGDWQERVLSDLQGRAFAEKNEASDDAEVLFEDLSRRLTSEGFSPTDIAAFVNARIVTGGRLPYCNADEVTAALV